MIYIKRFQLLGAVSLTAICTLLCISRPTIGEGASQKDDYIDSTVCELAAHPDQFNNKRVRVHASVGSDGIEHTGLEDENCTGKGVALWVSKEAEKKDGTLVALHEAIMRLGLPGTSDRKTIIGIFLGRFEAHPKDSPSRMFYLERISDLTIHIKGN